VIAGFILGTAVALFLVGQLLCFYFFPLMLSDRLSKILVRGFPRFLSPSLCSFRPNLVYCNFPILCILFL
jgi:hypothetical protein